MRTFTVGLGGDYDRVRADARLWAVGHAARFSRPISATAPRCTTSGPCRIMWRRRTNSELLCQGAVAGTSRSVYSGLIRVHRGRGALRRPPDQPQPGLDEGAHADSVPNLDILENDVKCSPRLDRRTDRRGPALLHRVSRRGARRGRGADRPGVLRPHHRPWPHPGRHAAAEARSPRAARRRVRRPSTAGRWPMPETVVLCAGSTTCRPARPDGSMWPVTASPLSAPTTNSTPVGDRCSHENYSLAEGEVWVEDARSSARGTAARSAC